MEEPHSFSPLLIVVLLAFVVPLALSRFRRLRLPIVVGEILAGVLIGRSGLHWIEGNDPVLALLADFGFVFLMFLSGMEVDFSNLGLTRTEDPRHSKRERGPLSLAGLSFAIALALSAVIGLLLVQAGLARNPWMMALILSTTSLGVVMPVLKETGLSSGRYGQTLLVAALVADFVTMFLITVMVAILSKGMTFDILLVGLLFVAFFLMYRFGVIFNRIPAVRRMIEELGHTTARIKVRAAFTAMLIFVVLAERLGTEIILGAFLAGAIVSLLRTPDDVEIAHQLEAIGFGFLIPIFFIMVGVNFNFEALQSSPQATLLVPILLVAALVVKIVPAMVFRLAYSWRETLAAGALLSARLSLIIAASAIGLKLGVIGEAVNAAIILVAILTVTFAPLLFTGLMADRGSTTESLIVVAGAGELGVQVAEQLRAHNERIVLIDADAARVERARRRGFEAVAAALERPQAAAYLDRARTLVCAYTDDEVNYRVCHTARTVYGIDRVIAQVSEPGNLARYERLGVTTMNPAVDRAALLALLARNPAMYQLLTRTDDSKEVVEVLVGSPTCIGKPLRQLALPGDVLVLAVRRSGELIVPHGDTRLERGNHITLVGSLEHIEDARRMLA